MMTELTAILEAGKGAKDVATVQKAFSTTKGVSSISASDTTPDDENTAEDAKKEAIPKIQVNGSEANGANSNGKVSFSGDADKVMAKDSE
jgi:hypothetical protein